MECPEVQRKRAFSHSSHGRCMSPERDVPDGIRQASNASLFAPAAMVPNGARSFSQWRNDMTHLWSFH